MGSGKHSSSRRDKKNRFEDDYYSNLKNNREESNDYSNSYENDNYNSQISNTYENNTDDNNNQLNNAVNDLNDNYERNINFAESSFWDEDEDKELDYRKVIVVVAIIILAIVAGILVYKFVINKPETEPDVPEVQEPVTMTESISGYNVLGKIVISDLGIEQYILDSIESKALQNGVGRIDNGASINNYGNFCLAGHNTETIFKKLSELEVGDQFVLVDRKMNETIYQITNMFEVEPDNLECLLQDESKVEVTLITCQDGATTRLVVKAQEKSNLASTPVTDTNTVNTEGEEDI